MVWFQILWLVVPCLAVLRPNPQSTAGVEGLIARRMPALADFFSFEIVNATTSPYNISDAPKDIYHITNGENGTIRISGSSGIGLTTGLKRYLTTYCHTDIYWFLEPRLDKLSLPLPGLDDDIVGSSIVPWRYHFNTVTFSYTSAFWDWDDWQLQLDWMALHGINLPLAWVGYEKILIDTFLDLGFSQDEINSFLSGPAFQAWNRFGNIQGSWVGDLPSSWVEGQFELNKLIVARMVELGMTPVLPCFTGFVPEAISRIAPNASFVNGSRWNDFSRQYTNVTFLEPFDPLFAELQKNFVTRQQEAYGNVSSIYALDQYNENDPFSGDITYLKNVTSNTYSSLQRVDPEAVWLLQGWLFYSSEDFWTDERVEAYLSGVDNSSMLILDLFSESKPQWQRTNNYYGKPWVWCMLHDFGGNMGLYGQVENVTINPIEALANASSSMVGIGLTMEGEEGNQIMYDLVLDQAWSKDPIDVEIYVHNWVRSRYNSSATEIFQAWDILGSTIYNNTNFTNAISVTKSILVLSPNTTGLFRSGTSHSTIIPYDPSDLVKAWALFYAAADSEQDLWSNDAYVLDLTDLTRQVLANAFVPYYRTFVAAANVSTSTYNISIARQAGQSMVSLLGDLDAILATSNSSEFSLHRWVDDAQAWSANTSTAAGYGIGANLTTQKISEFYKYNALNQITLWGPNGEINDYASKQWSGLVGQYYRLRWQMFVEYTLNSTTSATGVNAGLRTALLDFGEKFDVSTVQTESRRSLKEVLPEVVSRWPSVFNMDK